MYCMQEEAYSIKNTPLLTAAEERELITRSQQHGDEAARERLLTSNIGLVIHIAEQYSRVYQVDLDDLIQEGLLALLQALDKFDLTRNYRFTSYAYPWIHQYVSRSLRSSAYAVYLPDYAQIKLREIKRRLSAPEAPDVTTQDLAALTSQSVATIEALLQWVHPALSLDAPLSPDGETLSNSVGTSHEGAFSQISDQDLLEALLAGLSPRKREILRFFYGLDCTKLTMVEIGKRLGISKERVRQIRDVALKELRTAARRVA